MATELLLLGCLSITATMQRVISRRSGSNGISRPLGAGASTATATFRSATVLEGGFVTEKAIAETRGGPWITSGGLRLEIGSRRGPSDNLGLSDRL